MSDGHNMIWRLGGAAAVLMVVAWVAASRAEDGKADDSPDLSTAKSSALAWMDASWAGKVSVAHQILVDDEQQRKFMAASLRFSASLRTLESAAVKQFGESGRQVTGYPDCSAKAVEKNLRINEEGDLATASLEDAKMPLQLRRIDGKWRVDISEAVRDPRIPPNAGEAFDAATIIAEGIAAEIAEGKFKTVEEAKAAFRDRRLAAVKK